MLFSLTHLIRLLLLLTLLSCLKIRRKPRSAGPRSPGPPSAPHRRREAAKGTAPLTERGVAEVTGGSGSPPPGISPQPWAWRQLRSQLYLAPPRLPPSLPAEELLRAKASAEENMARGREGGRARLHALHPSRRVLTGTRAPPPAAAVTRGGAPRAALASEARVGRRGCQSAPTARAAPASPEPAGGGGSRGGCLRPVGAPGGAARGGLGGASSRLSGAGEAGRGRRRREGEPRGGAPAAEASLPPVRPPFLPPWHRLSRAGGDVTGQRERSRA